MKIWPTKRRLKRIAIGLGIVVALLLIANGLFAWWTERQWQNRLAAIRAAGDPASIADLAPHPIPDEQNAAVYIEKLAPVLKSLEKAFADFGKSEIGRDYEERDNRGESPTAEQRQAIEAILIAHAAIPTAVDAAIATGKYASRLDYTLDFDAFLEEQLESVHQIRSIARYFDWKMRTLVAEGKNEEAVQTGLQMLRLTRLFASEPTLVNHLVFVACQGIAVEGIDRALRAGPINAEVRKNLDEELKLHDDPRYIVHALKTERALFSSNFDASTPQVVSMVVRVLGWPIKRFYLGGLDYFDVQLNVVQEPWFQGHGKAGKFGVPESASEFGVLAELVYPAIQATYDASNRARALVRALRIHNALGAFREQHGRDAEGIGELPLAKEAVIDPFSGAPMKAKLTDKGWVIYTVFKNQQDDGGDFRELKDYGLAPAGYEKRLEP